MLTTFFDVLPTFVPYINAFDDNVMEYAGKIFRSIGIAAPLETPSTSDLSQGDMLSSIKKASSSPAFSGAVVAFTGFSLYSLLFY